MSRGNPSILHRSIKQPIRQGLSRSELWEGPDEGLIWCWELGRQLRESQPELAERALKGELVMLVWRGGVEKKLKGKKKSGSLNYLATWQGLRNDDLNIERNGIRFIVCSKTGQQVEFSAAFPSDDEEDG